jgi:hypothetical protein
VARLGISISGAIPRRPPPPPGGSPPWNHCSNDIPYATVSAVVVLSDYAMLGMQEIFRSTDDEDPRSIDPFSHHFGLSSKVLGCSHAWSSQTKLWPSLFPGRQLSW